MRILSILLVIILGCTAKNQFQPEYLPFTNSIIKINFQFELIDTINLVVISETVIPFKPQPPKTQQILKQGDYYITRKL